MRGYIFILLFVLSNGYLHSQQDSCFKLIWPHDRVNGFWNPDSVMYDSCSLGMSVLEYYNDSSRYPTEYFYAKKWFTVEIPLGALIVPNAPYDTLIFKNWTDVSSSFTDVRNGFDSLEVNYGEFLLRKLSPEDSLDNRWLIKFAQYNNIYSVMNFMKNYPSLELPGYGENYMLLDPINVNDSFFILTSNLVLCPQPAKNFLMIKNLFKWYDTFNSYKIYDLAGNILIDYTLINLENDIIIDVSKISNGIYFLEINTQFYRFIIQR